MKTALKSLVPSGTEYLAGALTAGVMFVGNHVLHVSFMQGSVETAVTPLAAFIVASIVHKKKPTVVVTPTVHETTVQQPTDEQILTAVRRVTAARQSVVLPASTGAPHIEQ